MQLNLRADAESLEVLLRARQCARVGVGGDDGFDPALGQYRRNHARACTDVPCGGARIGQWGGFDEF